MLRRVSSWTAPPVVLIGWRGVRAAAAYSGLTVGLIAVGFIAGTYVLLELPVSLPLLVLAGCGTALVYQVERSAGVAPEDVYNQPERMAWLRRHARGQRRVMVGLGAAGASMVPLLRPTTMLLGSALAVLSMLYAFPLLPGRRRLKSIWWLKPVAIAGAWAVGGVVLPVVEAGAGVPRGMPALLACRMLFVLPNALLADWPDRAGDARAGLRTVATEVPAGMLRCLAIASLVLAIAVGLFARWHDVLPPLLLVDLGGPALMLVAVLLPLQGSRWFYGLGLDLLVAWPAVTALLYGIA
jgi:hypothetical protein